VTGERGRKRIWVRMRGEGMRRKVIDGRTTYGLRGEDKEDDGASVGAVQEDGTGRELSSDDEDVKDHVDLFPTNRPDQKRTSAFASGRRPKTEEAVKTYQEESTQSSNPNRQPNVLVHPLQRVHADRRHARLPITQALPHRRVRQRAARERRVVEAGGDVDILVGDGHIDRAGLFRGRGGEGSLKVVADEAGGHDEIDDGGAGEEGEGGDVVEVEESRDS
jgi:hypothetical protein